MVFYSPLGPWLHCGTILKDIQLAELPVRSARASDTTAVFPKSQLLQFLTFYSRNVCAHLLSHVQLYAIPWTVPHPLSVGFSRQEYWSGLPFPPPGDLPNVGFEPKSPALTGRFFTTEPPGKPIKHSPINLLLAKLHLRICFQEIQPRA